MRNLKKFLALVMAMVMAFSLVLSASALDKYNQVKEWTDKDQVTEEFVEAVDVLSGMKIFQGDDRGFAPGATITRAETAALIYRLATGDVEDTRAGLYANYGNFKDVSEGDWYAGYVGYCANAGYIKGYNGNFNPYAPVTGYEALAMILRAVGYDKNHEFEGAAWQTNVSALGTRLGVLDDVKTSDYANTLHLASRRDVVASILFNTAKDVATVTYTPSLGYETNRVSNGTSDGWNARTLGKINFGLDYVEGIIVGNQDTGESKTRINFVNTSTSTNGGTNAPAYTAYFHQANNWNANLATPAIKTTTSTKTIDAKTGIEMFGHKVKAWYGTTKGVDGKTTYALYDKAEKTALVYATDSVLSNNAGNGNLGAKAVAAGFNVDLVNSKAVFNQSFGISGAKDGTDNDYRQDGTANIGALTPKPTRDTDDAQSDSTFGKNGGTAYGLYLLISNSSDKKVDMVVAVNAQVSRLVEVNNYASNPTVTVPNVGGAAPTDFNKNTKAMIEQAALTATSTKTLGDPVVAIAISGTNTSDDAQKTEVANNASASYVAAVPGYNTKAGAYAISNTLDTARYFYRLSKPTEYVEGVVTGYKNDTTTHTGSVTIGGKTIQRSALADAIIGYDCTADATNRGIESGHGIADSVSLSPAGNLYGKYRAYLDNDGNYIYLEPVYETKFVYGTYIDYTTPYASSSYEYTLVGVDLNGEQVKEVVKTVDGLTIASVANGTNSNYINMTDINIPYRDTNVGGVVPGDYEGFLLNDKGDLTRITGETVGTTAGSFPTINPEVKQAGSGTDGILSNAGSWNFTTTDAKLGTKLAKTGTTTYFTNDTKFIVVDGAGTDTQKVEVYTGINGLLDGATNVTINGGKVVAADNWLHKATDANQQMFYTSSPLSYASVDGTNPSKIDTIILPKAAVTWTGRSNLYFIGNNTHDSEITQGANTFYLYTMYEDGEQVQRWLTNAPGGTEAGTLKDGELIADSFYVLADSGYKTPMGDTVYYAHDGGTDTAGTNGVGVIEAATITSTKAIKEKLSADNRPDTLAANCFPVRGNGTTKVYYNATTYSAQTATIDDSAIGALTNAAIFNVSNAKVVNLNQYNHSTATSCVWPGINDLASLNDAASTAKVYNTNLPKVAVQTDPSDPLTITVIYVTYTQN